MKLVILDGYASNPGDLCWEEFASFGDLTVYERTSAQEAAARIGDAEIAFSNKVTIGAEVFDRCPHLRFLGIFATGYNMVDLQAARAHGITVCNVPAYSTQAVAQMTFALLLEHCQRVGMHHEAVLAGQWSRAKDFCFWNAPLTELSGKTFGIVGYGAIGKSVARIAQAIGLHVLITSRREVPVPKGARFVDLDSLLRQSDIVSLHCPQTAQTVGMIDSAAICKMKDGAILLNTARGTLLDEAAVARALHSGKLGAAAVDVVSKEPIDPENPLLTAPNCIITPHIAWAAKETRARLLKISVENLRAYLDGNPVNVVN
ncbi:MAG: D-2-hydroxyacid dehydrogenase [Oscillospiraceae bacterium]|jgi:glycerate dehydrogenase|nr:D-2-hydroxyacid dehydrogenase [Oscillospiraceae bacterium]